MMSRFLRYAGLTGVLVALLAFFGLASEHFFTALTLTTVANEIPALTVVAVGMTWVLIIAGIDLSVGSVLALGGAVLGVALGAWGWPVSLAMGACLLAGLACGSINGAITVKWSIPSFIVTLGMLEAARGGTYLVTSSQTQYVGEAIEGMSRPFLGTHLTVAFFLSLFVVILGQILLSYTALGRRARALGSNEEAARLSGVRPGRIKVFVFAFSGFLASLGGIFQCARLSSADPNAGMGLELSAIAAVVIGGTSLMGGRGSVISSYLGVLIIAVLQAGLAQMGASEPTKRVITGGVIVAAVILDAYRNRGTGLSWLGSLFGKGRSSVPPSTPSLH